jgi:hypothetical protein
MLWAAESRLRFNMTGGYGYVKHGGVLSGHSYPDPISVLGDRLTAGGSPPTRAEADAARGWLETLGVDDVLVVVTHDTGHSYEQAARAVLGSPPIAEGGVLMWPV